MKFKLIGDVSATVHFGYEFAEGPQDVVEPEFIAKLENHPNFEAVIDDSASDDGDPLEKMTKRELEALGREYGVELDRRRSQKALVAQMREVLNANND